MAAPDFSTLLVLISAPSGSGKTTLCEQVLAARPSLTRAVTCTTRPPRPGEKDRVDYYFLDPADFERRAQAGQFVEHATVHGCRYGVLKSELQTRLERGRDVLLNVDVQGAATIKNQAEQDPVLRRALVSVFLTPPDLATLQARLRKRGTDSLAVIEKRLSVAREEIAQWKHFHYLIVSSTIQEDLRCMLAILDAEHLRNPRAQPPRLDE